MNLPTIYFLTVEDCTEEWAIFETHQCQEKGCFRTEPRLIGWFETKEEALNCARNWKPLEGIVQSIEVICDDLPTLPEINASNVTDDFCGTYSDYPEMILAMAELSGMKAYKVVDDNGRILSFTFEVVE